MNKHRSAIKDIVKVAFSRGVSLFSGVVVGLLLPKLLSVADYGQLKIYTLYIAYTALLHFGFVDGILLHLAGKNYEQLQRTHIRAYTRFFIGFQFTVGAALSLCGLWASDAHYRFILLMLGIHMVIINLTTYYQFVSQATQRFTEYAARSFMLSLLKTAFVVLLLFLHLSKTALISYRLYIIGLTVIDGLLLLWYIWTYRDITFGKSSPLRECKNALLSLFKQGIVLTVAYQVSHLVFALDRQFVSLLYSTETYAHYSFAYNLVTMVSTMIASLSVVLLPMLKKASAAYIHRHYNQVLAIISVLVGGSLIGYYPLAMFIRWFLPDYETSIRYLQIVLPALMYSCCISVVMFTFCKALDQNLRFFWNSCIALGIGLLTNGFAQLLYGTPEAISYASLLTMMLWFWIEGQHLSRIVRSKIGKEFLYLSLLALGFILNTQLISSLWLGMLVYALCLVALTLAFYHDFLRQFVKKRFSRSENAHG